MHGVGHGGHAAFSDNLHHAVAVGDHVGGIGCRTRVAEDEAVEPLRRESGKTKGDVAAHREAAERDGLGKCQLIEQVAKIRHKVVERGHRRTAVGAAEAPQVWSDHPETVGKPDKLALPHAVVERKPVHAEEERALAGLKKRQLSACGEGHGGWWGRRVHNVYEPRASRL